jgi:hypothetical protein
VPKSKKKDTSVIGVIDKTLGKVISEQLQYECKTSEVIFEIFRGIR